MKQTLQRYKDLQDIIAILGIDELSDNDKLIVGRALSAAAWIAMGYALFVAFLWAGPPAVGLSEAVGLGLFDCNSLEERVMKLVNHKALLPTWAGRTITAALSLTLALGTVYVTTNHTAFAQRAEKVGKDVKAPKLIYKVEPSYDPSAKDDKVEGAVVLSLVVTAEGVAEDIQVVKSRN